ncbi:type II CAAX prenyl endopeptidase Rce1 family protein [Pseudomonas syringae]|uniref:CPBP family glutamic-type intramembrane protease n=1 Tax=Pseudomonas syringae TaxID=317 RepID=UPI000E321CD3
MEEIAFRQFILGMLPFKQNFLVATVAVTLSSIWFMYAHLGRYDFWPTHALMLTLGMIFSVERIQTGGLCCRWFCTARRWQLLLPPTSFGALWVGELLRNRCEWFQTFLDEGGDEQLL